MRRVYATITRDHVTMYHPGVADGLRWDGEVKVYMYEPGIGYYRKFVSPCAYVFGMKIPIISESIRRINTKLAITKRLNREGYTVEWFDQRPT